MLNLPHGPSPPFPRRFLLPTHASMAGEPLKTLSIWGAVPHFGLLVDFLLALCPPMAEEPLKTLWLGAHATCTACPPHSNLSCQSLLAYSSSMAGEPVKNPFSVTYWVTPKTFLRLFSASSLTPLPAMLDYQPMAHS